MSLSDWQGSFNGLTFGAGQDVGITGITGLRGLPDMRIAEPAKPRADGSYPAVQLMGGRTVKLSLDLAAPNTDQYYEDLADVAAAFGPLEDPANGGAPLPFEFQDPSWSDPRFVNCRPTKGEINMDLAYAQGLAIFDVELLCDDPLIYDTNVQSVSCGGSAVEVTNEGNYPVNPWFEIIGPYEWFEITVGGFVLITCTTTLTGAGVAYLDCATHSTYRANGQNLYPNLSALPIWFSLPPGVETEVEVTFGSGSGTTAATVNFASGWAWV